jgi:hypothetical protein
MDARIKELKPGIAHPSGKARSYAECCMYLTVFMRLYETEQKRRADDPHWSRINIKKLARTASYCSGFGNETGWDIARQFLDDGTVLVASTENHGRGSPAYIDNARCLQPEHLKFIDEQVDKVHDEGGSMSVAMLRDMLMAEFEGLQVTPGAVHYALVHFCNNGDGLKWGEVKSRKCETDPTRIDVKRTYLRDLAAALQKQLRGEAILVFVDESYVHQNHSPRFCWIKPGPDGAYINRGNSKGKRLIFIHGAHSLFVTQLSNVTGALATQPLRRMAHCV